MGKSAVIAALAALSCALVAFAERPPDSKVVGNAAMARRGSLGANDYVVTNVAPCSSCYDLRAPSDGRLCDRAVNAVEAAGNVSLSVPTNAAAPGAARAFCVYLKATGSGGCAVTVGGAARILAPGGSDGLSFGRGEHVLSFVELEGGVFLVDSRELTEL